MTISITLFHTQLNNLIPSIPTSNEVSTGNQYQQIKQAVIDYSRLKPDTVTADLTGDGGRFYEINSTNLPGYSEEFSRISRIEYPAQAVSADEVPQYLDPEDWDEDYYDTTKRYLFLPNHAPAATETMRITYPGLYDWTVGTTTTSVAQVSHGFSVNDYVYQNTSSTWVAAGSSANLLATHRVTAVADSGNFTAKDLVVDIPEIDFFAVCNRAACLVCNEIAARYSRTSDSTISADSVDHPSRAKEFRAAAKVFCDKWAEAMGIGAGEDGAGGNLPASEFVDWDTGAGWPAGRQFIFHGSDVR